MINGILALYLLQALKLFLLASCVLHTVYGILTEQFEVLYTKCSNHLIS